MADDTHKQALTALAACITAANVGETVLETDACKSFPDDSIESAPGLCYDVSYQKKCVIMSYVVIAKVQGYCDYAVYGKIIREDGSTTGYRSLEHLQYISSVDVPSGPAYPNGPELKHTLKNRVTKAKEDGVSATMFCKSRQFSVIKQMNAVSSILSEAGKSLEGKARPEADAEGEARPEAEDAADGAADDAQQEDMRPAVPPAAAETASKDTEKLSKTTDEVRAWLVSKFNELTRFSKQSLVWVFDLHHGVRKGLVTSLPAIEIAGDKNRSSTTLFFSGLEVSI
jgi:hypothetical protein